MQADNELDPIKKEIETWIKETLSSPKDELNHLSICPYALEALINKEFEVSSITHDVKNTLVSALENFSSLNKRVIVLACPKSKISLEDTQELVLSLREKYAPKNLWVMYDHPDQDERVQNINFSFGSSLLFFVQRLDDLSKAAQSLQEKGYYKNWSKDYFHRVFVTRDNYHKKNL
ncbi:MAG: hypothetical protein HRT44_03185 [Bdellovibrionales bacterium]|nr:hypothetical protein [Bdellovibrionales bacterium]NQZ18250.1 hypothetical protein [Bdellovibrionales bacterium]